MKEATGLSSGGRIAEQRLKMYMGGILEKGDRFGEFLVREKLSTHHDGEREVYLAGKEGEERVVLTVFSLECPRYGENYSEDITEPYFIEELWFLTEHPGLQGVPTLLDWGFQTYEGSRFVWMTQAYVEAESLHSLIWKRKTLPLADAVAIARSIGKVVEKVVQFTGGGGHYNLSPHNVLVRYADNRLQEVFLIGFTNLNVKYCRRRPNTIYYGRHSFLPPPPLDIGSLDTRVRPTEIYDGTCNAKVDVYALGMLTMMMLTGYPELMEVRRFMCTYTDELMETELIRPQDFRETMWWRKEEYLTTVQKKALKLATNLDAKKRLDSIGEFMEYLHEFEMEVAIAKACVDFRISGHVSECKDSNRTS